MIGIMDSQSVLGIEWLAVAFTETVVTASHAVKQNELTNTPVRSRRRSRSAMMVHASFRSPFRELI